MSLPKKNTRAIVVDDKSYRYLIKSSRSLTNMDKTLTLIVQEDVDGPGRPMFVDVGGITIVGGKNLGIGPGDIRQIIRKGIEQGWDPSNKQNPVFRLNKVQIQRPVAEQSVREESQTR